MRRPGGLFIHLIFVAPLLARSVFASGTYSYAPNITGFSSSKGRCCSAAASVGNSEVVVHGGADGSTLYDDLFLFDFTQNTATLLNQSMLRPSARYGHGAEWVSGYFTTCQGLSSSSPNYRNECWKYNQTSSKWTELTSVTSGPLPAVWFPGTSVDKNSRFLLTFGGRDNFGVYTSALWRIDVTNVGSAELVNSTGDVPSGRLGTVLVRKGTTDTFLLFGGRNSISLNEVYQLILTGLDAIWTQLTSSPGWDGAGFGIGMWDPVRGVALFGFASKDSVSNYMYISDGIGANWTLLSPNGTIPTARDNAGYASVTLASGGTALFGIGGYFSNGSATYLADAFFLRATTVPTTGATDGSVGTTTAGAASSAATTGAGLLSTASTVSLATTALLPPVGPNLTIGVPTSRCKASLFNATAFSEQLAAAYFPECIIDPADVVIIDVRCVGEVLEVTFALSSTGNYSTGGLLPPPLLSSSGSSGSTFNGTTTWTIISWPGYTTVSESASASSLSSGTTSPSLSSSGSSGAASLALLLSLSCIVALVIVCLVAGLVVSLRRYRLASSRRSTVDSDFESTIPMQEVILHQHESIWRVTAVKLLGSGNFGAVYEGRLDGTSKRIAIKEVRSGDSDEMQREADMLMKCQHEFVVQLLGVVGSDSITVAPGCPALGGDGESRCMLTELCEYGSLEDALRKAKAGSPEVAVLTLETVSASWLLLVFWQVAEAMRFLTCEAKVLHRDLAARNVLLARASDGYASGLANSDGLGICARVSDFGLSESMYADYYDKQQGGAEALPLRWTAPEALLKHKFSEKSDVYSFGVLMVETLNMGALPLSAVPKAEIVNSVQAAVQLSSKYLAAFDFDKPAPFVAAGTQEPLDEGLWELVLRCVSVRAEDRPTFSECSLELKQFLERASTTVFLPPPRHAGLLCVAEADKEGKYGRVAGHADDADYGTVARVADADYGTVARATKK